MLAIAFRCVGVLISYGSNVAFPQQHEMSFSVVEPSDPFWNSFARYDSGWYWSIAHDGYRYIPEQPNTLAFFPLYPLAMRAGGELLGGGRLAYFQAGIAVSWGAFVLGMLMLYRLARLDVDEDSAHRAVLYAMVFPFAFFYGKIYSESLFLLTVVTSVYAFRRGQWALGAVAGALATATRVNGILLLPVLAWLAWQGTRNDRRQQAYAALAVVGAGSGFAAYCLYNYLLSGSPLEWMSSIERWNYHPGGAPWEPLVALARQLVRRPREFLLEPNGLYDTLNGMTAMAFVAAIPFVWRRLGAGYAMYMAINLLLPLSSGEFEGLGRYCAVLFPVFIWAGTWQGPIVQQLAVAGAAAAYALCVSLWVNLHPLF
ncbi:MAG: mannosyltransferase family protein [Vicinamibacterales bacterium]